MTRQINDAPLPNDRKVTNPIDWAEPLIRAQQALRKAQDALALGRHEEGRAQLWIVLRAINEASNASLDISPAKT